MPRPCSVCTHPEHAAIDAALVRGMACRELAALYRVSPDAMERHKAAHLPATLLKAQDAQEAAQADDLLAQVRALQTRALAILDSAEAAGDLRTALGAIREARGTLELLAKLTGDLDERPVVNVLVTPQWAATRMALLAALQPYPDARVAVAGALLVLEAS